VAASGLAAADFERAAPVRKGKPSFGILAPSRGRLFFGSGDASRRFLERSYMKSRDTLMRLKRFQLEEKRRRVRQIETMLAEFGRMSAELDREIMNEEKRAGISDPHHFAYPTYARAASARRDNLKSSIVELEAQIDEARAAQEEAEAELVKFESMDVRDKASDRPPEAVARA